MENQVQRIQVNTRKFYRPESSLPFSQYQPNHHTPNRISKISRNALRLQAKLERTYYQGEKTNRLKSEIGNLAKREKIPSTHRKQFTSIQSDNQINMELWNRTVGLCQQVQQNHHAESPIKSPQSHNKCTPVCNKPHSPYRLQHPLCK